MNYPGKNLAPVPDPLAFLAGGGEMGSLIRSMDWSKTALGPVTGWPQSLRTTVSICLSSDLPICIIWGPGLVQLYNDAYRVICGDKHPQSMGQNFSECWKEAWPVIGEAHDSARAGDKAFLEVQQIFLERHGYVEECFFTFSFSPIRDEAGGVGGLFHPVIEMTAQMLSERRTRALRDLAAQTSQAKSVHEALSLSAQTLAQYDLDVPFALFYALEPDSDRVRLVGVTNLQAASVAPSFWPLEEVSRSRATVQIDDLAGRIGPAGTYPESPVTALALPIIMPGADRPVAIFITGISPRLRIDEAYRSFCDSLASAVTSVVINARVYEDERRRAKALADIDRAKTIFFSNVSHEFRTPLTLILGPVEDALASSGESLPPLQRMRLELAQRNGLRLQRLVNNLLDFSRIEAGRIRAAYEPTALADLTADLASNFRSACESTGLTLRVDCPPLDEPVFVDRAMWEKIVLNLLSNAFKFTFEGEIAVLLRQVGLAAELRVQDTGTGIPSEDIPRLFERFYRVENTHGRTHEGSGIGLSLVQELVKLHGGEITVESKLGHGTTFTVSIPMGAQHLPGDQVGSSHAALQPTVGGNLFVEEALRWLPDADQRLVDDPALPSFTDASQGDDRPLVLVADDNADMRQYLVRLLAPHYRAEAVADGQAALASAQARTPDLILTDVMMPRLDGFGLLQALRADPRTSAVPVIMLSARAGEESRIEGMEEGADDYLVKPFSARELLARIAAHLQMARMRLDANEALRASKEHYRLLVEQTVDGIFVANTEGRYVEVNTAGCEMLGYNREEVLARRVSDVLQPDEWPRLGPELARFKDGQVARSEWRMRRKDGSAFVGEVSGRRLPDGRLQGVVRDITERRVAEDAIRASEGRSRTILESISDGFFALDGDWRFSYINAAGEKFLNRTVPGDLVGKSLWEEYPGTVGSEFEQVYRRVADGEGAESFTAYYPNLDRWYQLTAYPAPVGLSVYFRDVTVEKQVEQMLQDSEERRRLALEAAELGTWHVDIKTRMTQTDARFRAIFGTTEEWIDYLQAVALVHPDDQPAVLEAVAAATRLDDPAPYAIEYRIIHPDGSLRWIFAKGLSSFQGTGLTRRVTSFDGTVADITERKRDEEERERLVAQLQEQDQRKDEFLATLAHELRNPLAPIRNGLQIMRMAPGNADANERIRAMMERQLGQMVHLVDDLLDLSRISRGKIDLRKERIELASVIAQAIETSRPSIDQAGHELFVEVPSGPIYVDADVTRLTQVFSNLLNNAAKFTKPKGQLRLAVQLMGAEVVVSVKDNGIGIQTHLLQQVFEMFTRVESNLERSQGGLGIGLSIVHRLVQMHGGSVEARSNGPGRGSEFIVRLPVALALAGNKPVDKANLLHPTVRLRILIADDNVDSAESLAMLLTLQGYDTKTTHDGDAALEVAATFKPDVILLDIGMPKLNGYEVCRRIRLQAWGKRMMVIALTGWGQQDDRRKSHTAGFDFHLVKPVDPEALYKLLTGVTTKVYRSSDREGELMDGRPRNAILQNQTSMQLNQTQEKLLQVQEEDAAGQLIDGIAHDFNNLLQIISADLHLIMKQGTVSSDIEKRINNIQEAVKRGARLADQLLALSPGRAL